MSSFGGKQYSFFSAIANHPIAIHFVHRGLAYLLVILILLWTWLAAREKNSRLFNRIKWLPLLLVLLQVYLGIMAALTSIKAVPQGWGIFEWNAQLLQLVAMFLLLALTFAVFLLRRDKKFV